MYTQALARELMGRESGVKERVEGKEGEMYVTFDSCALYPSTLSLGFAMFAGTQGWRPAGASLPSSGLERLARHWLPFRRARLRYDLHMFA